jgi:tetratricopeptide (TPR) repeat protein
MGDEKQLIVKMAFVYTQNGDWYKAIEEYRKILQLEPTNATMYNSIGDCYARKGDDQDAMDAYWQARDLFSSQGNCAKALSVEKKLSRLSLDRMDPKHKNQLRTLQRTVEADVMAQEGRTDEAVALYRQMIEAEPSNYSYREKLSALFLENAQVTEAAEELRAIAFSNLEAGRMEPARLYAQKAADLDLDSPSQVRLECALAETSGDAANEGELQERLGKSELEAGRPELALEALQKAQAAGRPGLDALLAKTLLGLKRFPEARAAYLKLHEASPNDESIIESLLALDEQAKDWNAAFSWVNILLAAHPEHQGFTLRGARIHQYLGKNTEAAQLYLRLAGLAFKDGHYDSVLGYFQSVLAIQPENLEVLKKKAEMLFKMGRKADTIAAYRELEKILSKKNPEEARKLAVLINRIQTLPEQPGRGTLH